MLRAVKRVAGRSVAPEKAAGTEATEACVGVAKAGAKPRTVGAFWSSAAWASGVARDMGTTKVTQSPNAAAARAPRSTADRERMLAERDGSSEKEGTPLNPVWARMAIEVSAVTHDA